MINRRQILASGVAAMAASIPLAAKDRLVDAHVHLFDPAKFPYHPSATYKPPAEPLEPYLDFVKQAGVTHAIIVHPEPYQDDHRYLSYCFEHERPTGLFKGTCLFDPIDPATPKRMEDIVKRHPKRIVAIRIHAVNGPGEAPLRTGPIKNRDLRDPAMKATWRAAAKLGIAVQMHFAPHHAPEIEALATEFKEVPVILDHMGRFGQGKPVDYDAIMALALLPKIYFKFSGWGYSSKAPAPHADLKKFTKGAFDNFGAERIMWGGLGMNMAGFKAANAVFDAQFGFASAADRALIRGGTAAKLFQLS
jgi:predicted TIM-barrel fold metal-dependent hydrolase